MNKGYIYLITNQINGKRYVGQTTKTVHNRWLSHCSNARKDDPPIGIDAAIKKYGPEYFTVEQIKECPFEELDKWEIYYIQYYQTYQGDNADKGYNLTLGGQGGYKYDIDEEELVQLYLNGMTAVELGHYYNCSDRTIGKRLAKYGIDTTQHHRDWMKQHPENWQKNLLQGQNNQSGRFKEGDGAKAVRLIERDLTFSSLKECSQWLFNNGYSRASSWEMVRKGLSNCLTHNRKTYLGFHFEYTDHD